MNCFPSDQKKINYVDYNMFKILDKSDTNNYVRITNKGSNCTDSSFIPVYSINNYIFKKKLDISCCDSKNKKTTCENFNDKWDNIFKKN